MARFPLGSLQPTGRVVRAGRKSERCVEYHCAACGGTFAIYPSNVRTGKTTGCRCQRGVKYGGDPRAAVLGERYDAILQRCTAPTNGAYKNYGARGIEIRFDSRAHFIRWALEHLPHSSYRGVQIDRRDNGGHYEPGNLRLVTQRENLRNKRTTRRVDYFGEPVVRADLFDRIVQDFPHFALARATLPNYVSERKSGLPLGEILRRGGVTAAGVVGRASRASTTS